jgi:adenylylsulfate kinase
VTLIALAGLPGAGKSTLARVLAAELGAPVFDKDTVRAALFGPDRIEYSREQDDLCWELTLRAAAWELARRRPACAILDGRTYCRAGQVEALRTFAARAGLPLLLVECTCGEAAACERLAGDAGRPAGTRRPTEVRSCTAGCGSRPCRSRAPSSSSTPSGCRSTSSWPRCAGRCGPGLRIPTRLCAYATPPDPASLSPSTPGDPAGRAGRGPGPARRPGGGPGPPRPHRGHGHVGFNSLSTGPFAGVPAGTPVALRVDIALPGVPLAPGQYENYTIQTATSYLKVGATTITFKPGGEPIGLQNNFPVADGVHLFTTGMSPTYFMEFELFDGTGGQIFDSPDYEATPATTARRCSSRSTGMCSVRARWASRCSRS